MNILLGFIGFALALSLVGTLANNKTGNPSDSPALPTPVPPQTQSEKVAAPVNKIKTAQPTLAPREPQPPQNLSPAKQVVDYSSFSNVEFEIYEADPRSRLNQNTVVIGLVKDFLPRDDRGGSANYIEIANPAEQNTTKGKIVAKVLDDSAYTAAVQAFRQEESAVRKFVRIYGVGAPSGDFSLSTAFGSYSTPLPTILAKRIDQCKHGELQTTVWSGSRLSEIFTCTEWTTVFPVNVVAQPQVQSLGATTQFSAGNTATISPTNPRAIRITGDGFCSHNVGVSSIQIGSYLVPDKNISLWQTNMIEFVIPDTIPKSNYEVIITGYSSAGYCPVVRWGRINVP